MECKPQIYRCTGHYSECAVSIVLQGHQKLGCVSVGPEVKLLEVTVSHEHAISAIVVAGIFGRWCIGVNGRVRRKLEAKFVVRACGDLCGLN